MTIPFEAMRFKQLRFGPMLHQAAANPDFFNQVHVIFGGTGAVGGSTALRILSFYDEAASYGNRPDNNQFHLAVTGLKKSEIRDFTTRLFHTHERRFGHIPEQIKGLGYRTANNAVIHMESFSIEPSLPELQILKRESEHQAVEHFLESHQLTDVSPLLEKRDTLINAIRGQGKGAFSHYLEGFRERFLKTGENKPFNSVVVGIPLPSVATYHSNDLVRFAHALGIQSEEDLNLLKDAYLEAFPEDLAFVADHLAKEVVVAHTTAVGGMYDEDPDGNRTIRLGFAHSASGAKMLEKQRHAETMTRLYSQRNIKMLVTAAAIGIDEILSHTTSPLMPAIYYQLEQALAEGYRLVPEADLKHKSLHVYQPCELNVLNPGQEPIEMTKGHPLVMDYVIRSGENGFFTVPNAQALYRVMRVASDSELGFVMARTAVFGDYAHNPRFRENICYYTETDYSRQVFDLLGQPSLRENELSGLQPKALQFLGSCKHQSELHTLGLLILLHRLKTLDLSSVRSRGPLETFDAAHYFETHSRTLKYDDVVTWRVETLADELRTLITAKQVTDLDRFVPVYHLHPRRQEAIHRILRLVLHAVWTVPSLGTPLLFERDDQVMALTGPYAAPVDAVLPFRYSLKKRLRKSFRHKQDHPDETEFRRFCEWHFANGFADLRPGATLVTTRSPEENLEGKVTTYSNEKEFLKALAELEPYSFFTTSGLTALLVRLKGLARWAGELDLSIGTANDFRSHFMHDDSGQVPVVPGVVEAFRMFSEGHEKNTGSEPLDGKWGYGWTLPEGR
ncbi:MAG: hypothetical protein QNK37_31920 [Acidobacteriota bacterium]|nr:hypothetical protein [Acidobacteriota bacterium]